MLSWTRSLARFAEYFSDLEREATWVSWPQSKGTGTPTPRWISEADGPLVILGSDLVVAGEEKVEEKGKGWLGWMWGSKKE